MTKPNLLQKKNEMEVFSSKNMIKKNQSLDFNSES